MTTHTFRVSFECDTDDMVDMLISALPFQTTAGQYIDVIREMSDREIKYQIRLSLREHGFGTELDGLTHLSPTAQQSVSFAARTRIGMIEW